MEEKLREPEPPKPAPETGTLPEWFGRFRDPKYKEALCRQHGFPLLSRDRHFTLTASPGLQRLAW